MKIPRSEKELFDTLKKHLDLLNEYAEKAFQKNDDKYYGEVAGKLRVLVYESRSNKPLLTALMRQHNSRIALEFDRIGTIENKTLEQFLASLAVVVRVGSGTPLERLMEISKMDLIGLWAQQIGSAHEDWGISEELERVINSGVIIGNDTPIHVVELRGITNTILKFGYTFLESQKYKGNGIP